MEFRRVSPEEAGFKAPQREAVIVFNPNPLPPELMPTPVAKGGGRYEKLPTHFQNIDDEVGRVWWRVEPGTQRVSVGPGLEGTLIEGSEELLIRRSRRDEEDKRIEELRPVIKTGFESVEEATGLYFERLGLGLTNIESVSVRLKDEKELREALGPEFYELAEQTATITLKLTREISTAMGKPLTPELFIQIVSLAMDILGVGLETQADTFTSGTTTKVDKEAARRLWREGKIDEGDVEFVKSYALTPDSMPRTAVKKGKNGKEPQEE